MVGLNFSDRSEAAQFNKAVEAKVFERQEKRMSKFKYRFYKSVQWRAAIFITPVDCIPFPHVY